MSVLIVDDHPGFLSFTSAFLGAEGFDVVGVAEDGETALEAVESLRPDVVLLDVQLAGMDGFEVARRIAETSAPPRVVLMSTREASDYGSRLAAAPANGFIAKRELSIEALAALLTPA
jgi:DNA-binding NarL/FixJ family response regulator